MNKKNRKLPYIVAGILVVLTLICIVFAILAEPADKNNAEAVAEDNMAAVESISEEEKMADADASVQSEDISAQNEESGSENEDATSPSEEISTEATSDSNDKPDAAETANSEETTESELNQKESSQSESSTETQPETEAQSDTESQQENTSQPESETEPQPEAEATSQQEATPQTGGHLVVIDPGHQSHGMSEKEPNGPGSDTMKAKVTGGTTGKTTGLTEYQLNLTVGLKLRDELQSRGYTVIMTRESNDVSLSNVDRAQIANNAGAEAFIRIHANGSDNTSTNGAMTICQTPSNPYNATFYSASRKLSDCVLDAFVASTGCNKQYVWETDTMTGINWANVPSTIIEMGYMSNPTEDTNMASEDYQRLMVVGIANGIDNYFR